MPSTKHLDVRGEKRRSALHVRENVIEVEIVTLSALHAAAAVTLPDFEFDCAWNEARVLQFGHPTIRECSRCRVALRRFEAEI